MTILIIENDKRLADLISQSLSCETVLRAGDLAAAKIFLSTMRPNLILVNPYLSDSKGAATLEALRSFNVPQIVLAGRSDDELIDAAAFGAVDYVAKVSPIDDLIARIRFNVAKYRPKMRFDPAVFSQIQAHLMSCRLA